MLDVLRGRIDRHGKQGDGLTHKFARLVSGNKEGPRSPHWPTIEKRWKANHPACEVCGSTVGIQVHHKVPFKHDPSLELQDGTGIAPATGGAGAKPNLVSLCEGADGKHHHHLLIGHGQNFQDDNLNVEKDIADAAAVYRAGGPGFEAAIQAIYDRAKANRVKS